MSKQRDPMDEHMRKMDLIFQEMQDRQDLELFARLKAVGNKLSDGKIRGFISACRDLGLKEGMTIPQSRAKGDAILNYCLEKCLFDGYLDV